MEITDDLDVGTTPAINTLVVVAHHSHIVLFIHQQLQQFILHIVGILIFIHNHILKTGSQLIRQIGQLLQHEHRIEQQVVKVHGIGFQKFLLVFRIIAGVLFFVRVLSIVASHFRSL